MVTILLGMLIGVALWDRLSLSFGSLDSIQLMIDPGSHPVSWSLLASELDEARGHLQDLVSKMAQGGRIGEDEFAVRLAHIYAHLNRVWHSRNQDSEITDEQWEPFSQFPTDIKPVG